jgi:hypothetical protein
MDDTGKPNPDPFLAELAALEAIGRVPAGGVAAVGKWPAVATAESLA